MLLLIASRADAQYQGTGSVTQGIGTTGLSNIYSCPNGRIPAVGTITASNTTEWVVPAEVNFDNALFPFASDLYNPCTGATYANTTEALAALGGSNIVEVDPGGDLITAFVFADNYFEMYVNGIAVGKDNVPYTQFNSNIVRFRAQRPFTISLLLVDWEEHLGIGTEASGGFSHHPGDGGVVVVLKDGTNSIIATTNGDWKAQTFYTAPITDLTCPAEIGAQRLSNTCAHSDSNDGSNYYGLHWERPAEWTTASFDDSDWPAASTYSNEAVGVNNKPAYTNFTDIFDDVQNDAAFIWSTNLILDNEVIVRYTVDAASTTNSIDASTRGGSLFPNPAHEKVYFSPSDGVSSVNIYDAEGRLLYSRRGSSTEVDVAGIEPGMYTMTVVRYGVRQTLKLMIQ